MERLLVKLKAEIPKASWSDVFMRDQIPGESTEDYLKAIRRIIPKIVGYEARGDCSYRVLTEQTGGYEFPIAVGMYENPQL